MKSDRESRMTRFMLVAMFHAASLSRAGFTGTPEQRFNLSKDEATRFIDQAEKNDILPVDKERA